MIALNVYNLSNISLTSGQLDLLGRGLGFSVSPSGVDKFQIVADTNEFVRRLRSREYFHASDGNGATSTALSEHPPKIQKHTNKIGFQKEAVTFFWTIISTYSKKK